MNTNVIKARLILMPLAYAYWMDSFAIPTFKGNDERVADEATGP